MKGRSGLVPLGTSRLAGPRTANTERAVRYSVLTGFSRPNARQVSNKSYLASPSLNPNPNLNANPRGSAPTGRHRPFVPSILPVVTYAVIYNYER